MTLEEYYLHYLTELARGTREPPEGICLPQGEPEAQARALQEQLEAMGMEEFVRRCAARDGEALPPELFAPAPQEAPEEGPRIEEPDGPRSAYEVLLDCCLLDEKLLQYLIDVLMRNAEEEFQKLTLVTTRKAFLPRDLLSWFAGKETRGSREELICVTIMDACLERLAAQGEKELMAALLSGDQTTFELFRCEAPELMHLPQATYSWYDTYYLRGYYPLRFLLKFNGISMEATES